MKKTCIAVIGCGRIADRAHFPVFKRLNSVRVKYACDIQLFKPQKCRNYSP